MKTASENPSPMNYEVFEAAIKTSLAPLAAGAVTALKSVYLSADVGPWQDTGADLQAGDRVTLVLSGRSWLSKAHDLYFEPWLSVWARIGTRGPVFRGTRDTHTFTAEAAGRLQLRHYSGLWVGSDGDYAGDPAPLNPDARGGVAVAIIVWSAAADIAAELQQIARQPAAAPWFAAEVARLQAAPAPPPDWSYVLNPGPAEIYRERREAPADGGPQPRIELRMHNEVGLLKKDCARELTPHTRLRWQWRVDRLPSAAAEDSVPTHDYISVAVEFDNGRDLTWFWSADLAPERHFHCPLPGWNACETHVVVRSGARALGAWLAEERNVFADYEQAIGGVLPARIVGVWLLGVSVFQRGSGAAAFGDIAIVDASGVHKIY
ncbi:MAG TPA: DUF3047 domain-containing protein [Dokdonella sp.]